MQLFNKNKIPFELSSSGPTQYGYISKDGDSYSIEYCEKIEMPKDEGIIRIIREDSAYFPSFNAVLEFPVNMNIYPSFVPFYTGYDLKDTLKEVFDYAQDVNNTHIFIINTDDGDKKHLVIPLQTLYEEDYDLFTVEGDILPEDMLVVEANGYSFRGKYFLADGTMIFEANGATLDIVGKDALYKKYTYEIFSRLNPGECLGFRAFDGGYKLYGASVDEDGVVLRDLHENFKNAFSLRKNTEQPHFVIYNNDTSFEGYWYKNSKEMSFSASIESCKNLLDVFISWAEAMEERGASIGLFETKKEPKVDLVKEE